MKRIDLIKIDHNIKVGDKCSYIEPNITDDCIFYSDNLPIGFYLTKMPDKMCKLIDIANSELMSKNVKLEGRVGLTGDGGAFNRKGRPEFEGKSVILGSVRPKPHLGRNYPNIASAHTNPKSKNFIKSMLLLAKESEGLIKNILPNQYDQQIEIFKQISEKWKFGNLFTSSISNYNLDCSYHIDNANIKGCVNVIICKKLNSKGGDLNIPDYNATIGQQDNSILVYPAWRNIHGVTPITPTFKGGYRNSFVFYPLKAFIGI
jgi:hypothetical protein